MIKEENQNLQSRFERDATTQSANVCGFFSEEVKTILSEIKRVT